MVPINTFVLPFCGCIKPGCAPSSPPVDDLDVAAATFLPETHSPLQGRLSGATRLLNVCNQFLCTLSVGDITI